MTHRNIFRSQAVCQAVAPDAPFGPPITATPDRVVAGPGSFRARGRYWDRTSDLFRVRDKHRAQHSPLSTKTVRGRPLMSPHIRGRCHAVSQSPNHPHISGRPPISEVFSLAVHPSLCNAKTGPKGWKKPRPRPDCRLRLRRLIRARWRCSRCGSNRHGPEASHRRTARHISPC